MKIPRWSWSLTTLVLVVLFIAPLNTFAQDTAPAVVAPPIQTPGIPIAGWDGTQFVLYDETGEPTMIPLSFDAIPGYAWNDSGELLALHGLRTNIGSIVSIEAQSKSVTTLYSGTIDYLPPTFMPDDSILFSTIGPVGVQILQMVPKADAQVVDHGALTFNVDCGGGEVPLPAEWATWQEVGDYRRLPTFAATPYGVLHSTTCRSGGLALFDLDTNVDQPIAGTEDMGMQTSLSADKSYVVASNWIRQPNPPPSLARIDLATGAITLLTPAHHPDQFAVGPDGMIYYSSAETVGSLLEELTPDQCDTVAQVFSHPPCGSSSVDIPRMTVSLYRYDPTTNTETILIDHLDVYAIGRIVPIENSWVLFSTIPNMDALVQASLNGTISNTYSGEAYALLPVTVMAVSSQPSSNLVPPAVVVQGLSHFTVPPLG